MFKHHVDEDIFLKLMYYQDSRELYHLISQSRNHLKKWMTWVEQIQTEADVIERIHKQLVEFTEKKGIHFLVFYKGTLAGTISLKYMDWAIKSAEIGYWLGKPYVGKGIMIRSSKSLLEYGFNELNLHKIEIWAAEENRSSRNIPEKLGFTQEGIRRHDEIINGNYINMVSYGLLYDEWKERTDEKEQYKNQDR